MLAFAIPDRVARKSGNGTFVLAKAAAPPSISFALGRVCAQIAGMPTATANGDSDSVIAMQGRLAQVPAATSNAASGGRSHRRSRSDLRSAIRCRFV